MTFSTPSPIPGAPIDETLISPGWIGFIVIFAIAVATVLLILDMTRRVRRVRYRSEVREQLAAEEAEGEGRRDDEG